MSEAVLIINRSDSICSNCGGGADPREEFHDRRLGYFAQDILDDPDHPMKKGCGAKFVAISSHYGDWIKEAAIKMRPDLPWTSKWGIG